MAGNIKGITIEFNAETTNLGKALKQIKDETGHVDKSLSQVNKSLKFNPRNIELLSQKQTLLKEKIGQTEQKLKAFKAAQEKMDSDKVSKTSAEYMEVRRNIIQCESQLKNFNGQLSKVDSSLSKVNKIGQKFQDVGGKMTSAGQTLKPVSMAAAGATTAVGALAVKAGRAADDINTLSKVSGIGTRKLQLYAASADLIDVSVEDMAKAQTKLKRNMLSASEGSGTAAKAFEKLGVKVTDSKGHLRSQDEVFQEVIEKLGKMKNETERDAYAMNIFGKSAANLNPLIKDMGRTYKTVTDTLKRNKIKLVDQKTLDNANKFNDQLDTMKFVAKAAFQQIGSKTASTLLPLVTKVQEVFSVIMGKIANLKGTTLSALGGIAAGVAVLAPLLLGIGFLTSKFGMALSTISRIAPGFSGALEKAFGFLKANPIFLVVAALAALGFAIGKSGMSAEQLSAKIQGVVQSIVAKMPMIIKTIITTIITVIQGIVKAAPLVIQGLITIIQALLQALPTLIPMIVNAGITLFTGLVDAIPKLIPVIINGITKAIIAIIEALPTLIPALIQGAVTLFMAIVKAIPVVVVALAQALPKIIIAFKDGLVKALPAVWTAIKNAMLTAFGGYINIARSKFNSVKNAIISPIENARDKIRNVIDRIKSFFSNLVLKIPTPSLPRLPHFDIDWGNTSIFGKKISYPRGFDVSWYAKGGIFDSPSVIGLGEAGREAALPLDPFWAKMDKMSDDIVNTVMMIMQSGNNGQVGTIHIDNYMYPSAPKAGETIVRLNEIYGKRLGKV